MKKVKIFSHNLILILFAFSLFTMYSCEVEGPIGPVGPTGKDGKDGVDGQDGQDGNANVVSITKTIAPSDWIATGTLGEDLYFYYEISIPEITDDIVQNGAVIIYYKDIYGSYHALPVTYYFYVSSVDYYYHSTIRYSYQIGKVRIELEDSDLNTYRLEESAEFKIVIIEGSVLKSLSIEFIN
jgi:hypothetical protein